jgi:hypothetical protein
MAKYRGSRFVSALALGSCQLIFRQLHAMEANMK